MEKKELKNKLIEKMENELREYENTLRGLSADGIMDNCYKLTGMIEIIDYLTYDKELSKFEIKMLLKKEHILEECYNGLSHYEENLREGLEFSVDDTIDFLRDREVEKQRNKEAR